MIVVKECHKLMFIQVVYCSFSKLTVTFCKLTPHEYILAHVTTIMGTCGIDIHRFHGFTLQAMEVSII